MKGPNQPPDRTAVLSSTAAAAALAAARRAQAAPASSWRTVAVLPAYTGQHRRAA